MKSFAKVLALFAITFFADIAYSQFKPLLIGGRPVQPGEYPEVIRISSGNSYCTATVVGPRVILTAAHCTSANGQIVPVSEKPNAHVFVVAQNEYKATCTISSLYSVGDHDMALCVTDREVPMKYASLSKEPVKLKDVISLIGYGCVNPGSGTGGNDGILRVGEAPVTRENIPGRYDFETKGSAALCYGDSGGPAFEQVKDAKNEHHYIVGVNSRANIRDLSLLTAVFHPQSVKFAEDFERKHAVLICGISAVCDEDKPEPSSCGEELGLLNYAVETLTQCLSK